MPEITDPQMLQAYQAQRMSQPQPAPQLPSQPMPFPGTSGPFVSSKRKAEGRADINTGIAQDTNQRGWAALANEQERLRIAEEEAARKRKTAAANMGVDTTSGQDKAAGHLTSLTTEMRILDDIRSKDPSALRPSWGEKVVGSLTEDPDYLSFAKNEQRQRASASYRNIIESALFLKTGSAYNREQYLGQIEALTPQMNDGEGVLQDKRLRLQAIIEATRAEAGPANVKVQEALSQLEKYLPAMYSAERSAKGGMEGYKLSTTKETVPIPEAMQQEHAAFLKDKPPGTLTVEDYIRFRQGLDMKYGFGQNDFSGATKYVEAYNKAGASQNIPATTRELSGLGQLAAEASSSELGTFGKNFANAVTFGAPEFFATREDRFASDLADQENWKSALAGDILGSLAPVVGLESLAVRGLTGLGAKEVGAKVGGDILANAGYGAVRGAAEAEPENRMSEALLGGALGGGGSILGRGLVKGGRGFMDEVTGKRIDDLTSSQTFDMPSQRQPLPADDITPPRMQGMSDDQLRQELATSRRALEVQQGASQKAAANQAERRALEQEAAQFASGNANRQERFVRENFRSSMTPEQVSALRQQAAQQFPTDPAEVLALPQYSQRAAQLTDVDTTGLMPADQLQTKIQRLEDYLGADPTPQTGTIPGVDLTTMQRAGATGTEEFLQGLPGVSGAREAAVESFNKQNSARTLSIIGEELPKAIAPGQASNAYVNQRLNNAYNAIRPQITGRVDRSFDNALAALRAKSVSGGPEKQALWQEIEATLTRFRNPDGTFDGRGYQEFSESMRGLAKDWNLGRTGTSSTAEREMARVAEQARKQAQALVSRSNPAVGSRLKNLEKAWAQQARIDMASRGAARSTRGVYAPDEYLSAIERLDTSRNKAAIARGQGLDQPYAQDARDVLGAKPAKRGSIKETGVAVAIGAGGGYLSAPLTAALAAVGISAYTPGVKRIMQKMVEGKLGKTVDKVTQKLPDNSPLKNLPSDSLKTIISQALRAYDDTKRD